MINGFKSRYKKLTKEKDVDYKKDELYFDENILKHKEPRYMSSCRMRR